MGQAKRRGTFEERQAQAIKAGRVKRPKPSQSVLRRAFQELMFSRKPRPAKLAEEK